MIGMWRSGRRLAPQFAPASDRPLLEIRDISVDRGGRRILNRVSLSISSGEMWAIVGPNGAGKSTMLEALVGATTLSGGQLALGGCLLSSLGLETRARAMALVGRELGHDTPLTVREVVQLGRLPYLGAWEGLSSEDIDLVDQALRAMDCWSFAERRLGSLSDGERQRVHFARALAQSPHLLLMDEATAHLDLAHRHEALARVRAFAADNKAALVVVHDLELAVRYATHIAVLNSGQLVAQGSPVSVLSRELLAEVFGVEAKLLSSEDGVWLHVLGPPMARRISSSGAGATMAANRAIESSGRGGYSPQGKKGEGE